MLYSYFVRNSRRSIKLDGKGEPKGTKRAKPVRYTAAKLHEKGVLLGIDDLQTNQWVRPGICMELHTPSNRCHNIWLTSLGFLWPLKRASFGLSRLTTDYRWQGGRACIVIFWSAIRPWASGAVGCMKRWAGHVSRGWPGAFGFASLPLASRKTES